MSGDANGGLYVRLGDDESTERGQHRLATADEIVEAVRRDGALAAKLVRTVRVAEPWKRTKVSSERYDTARASGVAGYLTATTKEKGQARAWEWYAAENGHGYAETQELAEVAVDRWLTDHGWVLVPATAPGDVRRDA